MKWSKEKTWKWYNSRPWMRGCNYMSADCANRVDQWQELGFEERFNTTKSELELMVRTGFNTIRIIPEFVVWQKEHDGFMERFERYIALCAKYGISCMVVLANDCMPPKSSDWKLPDIGEQKYDVGYHGGKKISQHGVHAGPAPHFYLDSPDTREEYMKMVRELVTVYAKDERICMWDLYNEPGASRRQELALPLVKLMFKEVRAINPIQPLTVGLSRIKGDELIPYPELERFVLDNEDIISYHFYGNYNEHVRIISRLKKEGRPIVCSEWLCRCTGNDVFMNFPLFWMEKIGCYNWGFVAGKYQTYEPWESTWTKYYSGEVTNIDFTKWFHDLYRPNHRPYDPQEILLIRQFCDYADDSFKRQSSD